MKFYQKRIFLISLAGVAAICLADEHMPNPGGGSNCYKLVNHDGCTLAGIGNANPLVCPTQNSRLVHSSPSVPIGVGAGTGEAGKTGVLAQPNVDCEYKSGYPNSGGPGCTWINTILTAPVTPNSLTGQDCTGKPSCSTCEM